MRNARGEELTRDEEVEGRRREYFCQFWNEKIRSEAILKVGAGEKVKGVVGECLKGK